jgi:sugar phosphate isomerase/epimerase
MRRLSLDHITVVDTTPAQLAELAAQTGCAGICAFLHAMPVLPDLPDYDLIRDAGARAHTRRVLRDTGVALDLVYPFTLTGRSEIADFAPALAAAAELGAPLANILCYDREPARRIDRLQALAELAAANGIELAIEPYPPSQIPSLAAALETVAAIGRPDIGITLDLLHLARAGEWPGLRGALTDPAIRLVQMSDGPAAILPADAEWEAGRQRLLPGEGEIPLAAMLAAIDPAMPISVEVPQQSAIDAGAPAVDRARRAVQAVREGLALLPQA